jgi:hypothetical protein
LGEWAAASGGRGGRLVAGDLLVFIRKLIFLTADFGCVMKNRAHQKFVGEAVTSGP